MLVSKASTYKPKSSQAHIGNEKYHGIKTENLEINFYQNIK